jgi:hypothetical protein
VLRGTERGLLLRQAGTLGGVLGHALAFGWPAMLSQEAGNRWQVERLQREIAKEKLLALVPVLARFEAEHGRRPASLAELAGSTRLDADALLIPGDEHIEEVALPGEPARALRTSFRYFPKPVTVDANGETHQVLFVAIAPHRYHPPMLTVDGGVPEVWGEVSTRPIDDFGN